ncbi:MAG: protein kinase domain-containing protein [Limisphaerales bacterium]
MKPTDDREDVLFREARQRPRGPEREAHLDQACAGNEALRKRLAALLQADDSPDPFLEPQVADLLGKLTTGPAPDFKVEEAGARIGRYKLLEKIGEGGCGVVYMAEQEEPIRRRVAFKVIKLGMDTKQVIARFEAERQALALMDNPNIAKVHDAGATDTGRPYFVMELVRGIKITEYCDQNNLSTEQRLALFIQACHAVQHAHQKGIIHRDIKPSNILVTVQDGKPVAKVIDFGIAKATAGQVLTDKTVHTAFEQFIGTPTYMSPEQAEMTPLDIDTRSDIYSLGVLLYELLTGKTPFDPRRLVEAGLEEIRRIIREEDPARPSTRLGTLAPEEQTALARRRQAEPAELIRLVRGDLDWIVMKSLDKDRSRRYATANGLTQDLQRYLANEPVLARPPSQSYRLGKLVRRNKLDFGAAAAVGVALAAGLAISALEAIRARRAESEQIQLRGQAEQARAKEAEQRHQAQAALYQGRLTETRALRQAHPPGWNALAMQNLRSNAMANLPQRDLVELRSEAVACLEGFDLREVTRLPAGGADIWSLDFSPDGALLACSELSGACRLWKLAGQQLLWEVSDAASTYPLIPEPKWAPTPAIRFHPLGNALAYGTWSNSVEVVSPGQRAHSLFRVTSGARPKCIAFDSKGAALAVAWGGGSVVIYDATTGSIRREIRLDRSPGALSYEPVALSPDGTLLAAVGDDQAIELHDLAQERPKVVLGRHEAAVRFLAFSPRGDLLVSASEDHTAKVFDVARAKERFTLIGHKARVNAAVFRPDGRVVATTSDDQTARLWDVRTGEALMLVRPGIGPLMAAAFSPDGQNLAVSREPAVLYRLTNEGAKRVLFGHAYFVNSLAFHPAEPLLASASADNSIILWDVVSGQVLEHLPGHPGGQAHGLAFSPDGRVLAVGHTGYFNYQPTDHRVRLWDRSAPSVPRTFAGHEYNTPVVSLDATGKLLGSGDAGGTVIIRDSGGESLARWRRDNDPVVGLQFVSPGPVVLAVHESGHVELCDYLSGTVQGETQLGAKAGALAISPAQDQCAVATEAGAIQILTLPDFRTIATIVQALAPGDSALAYSADGRVLAAGDSACRVSLWDVVSVKKVLELPRQEGLIRALAFEPNGSRLAIGSDEEQITVWDLEVVRKRLRELGLDWEPPAGPKGVQRANAAWPMRLADAWLNRTNRPPTNGLALARLAHLLAQEPKENSPALAKADGLSLKAIAAAPNDAEAWLIRAGVLEHKEDVAGALAVFDQAVEVNPQQAALWTAKGKLLAEHNQLQEAVQALSGAIALAAGAPATNGEILKATLGSRAALLVRLGRLEEAALDNCRARGIPPREPRAGANLVDLGPFYNAAFTEELYGTAGNVWPLPTGLLELDGVQFDVRGLVQLSGSVLERLRVEPRYPVSVPGIPLQGRFVRLHCLGATGWSQPDGQTIGRCVIHYADGQEADLPIVYGRDVRDWWDVGAQGPGDSLPAKVVWTGQNPAMPRHQGTLRLFKFTWSNPRPGADAQSLDFVSAMTQCAPFLIAITVE